MKLNVKLISGSIIIVVLTALLLPYSVNVDGRYGFGYPLAFINIGNQFPSIRHNTLMISLVGINLMYFIIDIVIVAGIMKVIIVFGNKFKIKRTNSDDM